MTHIYFCAQAQPTKYVRTKQKSALVYVLLHRGTWVRWYYARIHLKSSKIDRSAFRNGRGKKQWLWTARKTCVPLVFEFACFVFASVFISDEGGPCRVCQTPVSMQAIISPVLWSPCMCARVCMCLYLLWCWGTTCGYSYIYFYYVRGDLRRGTEGFNVCFISFNSKISVTFLAPKLKWLMGEQ